MVKLTNKQKRFVDEYLVDLNGAQAALRAGYSPRTAGDIGAENLGKPMIRQIIDEQIALRSQRTQITQDQVLQELAKIAFFDIRKLYDHDGRLLPIMDLPQNVAAAIASVDTVSGRGGVTTKKIKLIDKKGALELLGRHLKMFTDKVDHNVTGSKPVKAIKVSFVNAAKL